MGGGGGGRCELRPGLCGRVWLRCNRAEGECGVPPLLSAALRKLRGRNYNVEAEMEEMRTEERTEQAEGRLSVLNLFTFRPLRWQLISIVVLMAGQQLSGINAVRAVPPRPRFLVPLGLFE